MDAIIANAVADEVARLDSKLAGYQKLKSAVVDGNASTHAAMCALLQAYEHNGAARFSAQNLLLEHAFCPFDRQNMVHWRKHCDLYPEMTHKAGAARVLVSSEVRQGMCWLCCQK